LGDFRNLDVWQVAHSLARDIYRVTKDFPRVEAYGLTSQMRRSAVSIPANLAEGTGRRGDTELRRFIRICLGSAMELEYYLLLANDLALVEPAALADLTKRTRQVPAMLSGLHRSLTSEA